MITLAVFGEGSRQFSKCRVWIEWITPLLSRKSRSFLTARWEHRRGEYDVILNEIFLFSELKNSVLSVMREGCIPTLVILLTILISER